MRGGWSGFGMVTVGIHPNDFDLNPNKIPPGGVVQNWPTMTLMMTMMARMAAISDEAVVRCSKEGGGWYRLLQAHCGTVAAVAACVRLL